MKSILSTLAVATFSLMLTLTTASLTKENFSELAGERMVMVKFFAPWCGQRSTPEVPSSAERVRRPPTPCLSQKLAHTPAALPHPFVAHPVAVTLSAERLGVSPNVRKKKNRPDIRPSVAPEARP